MHNLHCTYRNHDIHAAIVEHPGIPTPWAAGCLITLPDGHCTTRIALPMRYAFLADLESAQHAALAHGRWLVDQHLEHGLELPVRRAAA